MDGMKKVSRLWGLFLILALGVGCADIYTARGVYHKVRPGETLWTLSKKYRIPLQDLAELNDIEDIRSVKVGRPIFVPGVRVGRSLRDREKGEIATITRRESPSPPRRLPEKKKESPVIEVDHGRFSWPVSGEVSSGFGVRSGRRHDGIDIRAPRGTAILAAADGEVVFAKRLRGYGNLILLKHHDNFFTVYAHTAVNLVRNGAHIREGKEIGKVGSTGRASGPHLHFEVRKGSKPRNPLFFLPTRH